LPQIHEMARQQQIGYLIGKYVQNMTSNNPWKGVLMLDLQINRAAFDLEI
jgi:hypothetical protein